MENAPINTQDIYVLFNYKTRMVSAVQGFNRKNYRGLDVKPANTREKNIFLEHFYSKGRRNVKFRDYKVVDPSFHGTAKYKKLYDTIALNESQYLKLLELMSVPENNCETVSQALNLLIERANELYYEYKRNYDVQKLAGETVEFVFKKIYEEFQKR